MNEVGKKVFLLIDLPVYPKGVIALSLPLLAGYLKDSFLVEVADVNFTDWEKKDLSEQLSKASFIGMKVSSQSYSYAKELTLQIKKDYPDKPIIWGGELPTLLPDECLRYADSVIRKRLEGCLEEFINDLNNHTLQKIYEGSSVCGTALLPDFSTFKKGGYYNFMGFPLETSTGCNRYCNFCMVHTMQKGITYKSITAIERELENIGSQFLNIIDYNIAMSKDHLLALCETISQSAITGWMGEMCIESLDDEEILMALQKSRCSMIYCGLESIDEHSLKSVNKGKTNHPENYRRIIKRAQSYGVNIASGFIVGLDGSTPETFENSLRFFNECGVIYVKLTFLTYNPGTFYHTSMKKSGTFLTDEIERFDGNSLTYLPHNTNAKELYKGTAYFIRNFYSFGSIVRRAIIAEKTFQKRLEFILFNTCYRNVYIEWIKKGLLQEETTAHKNLYADKFKKPLLVRTSDFLIKRLRLAS